MEREDYTALISYYIPNEIKYYVTFPLSILCEYNGASNLDVTIDDELLLYIIEPLIKGQIEYNYEIINEDWELKEQFNLCLKVNREKFNPKIIIDNLKKNQMINGLKLFKEEYNKLTEIYSNENK